MQSGIGAGLRAGEHPGLDFVDGAVGRLRRSGFTGLAHQRGSEDQQEYANCFLFFLP
jgi:hypothetical protein